MASMIPGSNADEIEAQIQKQVTFLTQLIKLQKLGKGDALKLGIKPPTEPPGSGLLGSQTGSTGNPGEALFKSRMAAWELGVKQKELEKEINLEQVRGLEILKAQADGKTELAALLEQQFTIEDKIGRKLTETKFTKLKGYNYETERLKGLITANEKAADVITEVWENVGRATEDAIVDSVFRATSALDSLKNIAASVAEDITRMFIRKNITEPLFSKGGGVLAGMMGFASGGSFDVGGQGGTDSQVVAFKASPNERVTVSTPGQQGGGGGNGGGGIIINQNFALGVVPTVRAELAAMIPSITQAVLAAGGDKRQRGGKYSRQMGV